MSNHKAKTLQAAFQVPNQKYLLEKKDEHGHYLKVETFDEPVTEEYVLKRYGPGKYFLKPCKPKFWKTLWHEELGTEPNTSHEGQDPATQNIQKVDQRTKHLGYALIGSFGTQALGFGLSHLRFSQIEDRIARVETALRSLPVQGLYCTLCSTPIPTMLQEFCNGCGNPIEWPRNSPTNNVTSSRNWSLP